MAAEQLVTLSGAVEQVNARGTGIKVLGEWLNVSQYHPINPMPTPGELVECVVEQTADKGVWINSLRILGAVPAALTPTSGPDRTTEIRRQVAMKCAAELTAAAIQSHEDARADWVFPLADRILAWFEQA